MPVIIVTARIAADNRIESFGAGADDYVPKPYTPDQIFEALDQSARVAASSLPLPRVEGQVVLDGRDDGETLRRLAQLRRLLLARAASSPRPSIESAAPSGRSGRASTSWSRRSRREQVATLAYALDAQELSLSVLDEGGWLESLPDPVAADGGGALAAAGFDQIVADRAAGCFKLVKRFEPLPQAAGGGP